NTLVLRVNTAHNTLTEYLNHVRQTHLDAQSNQDVPFEQLVDKLKVSRSLSHSPLFQIMVTTNTEFGVNSAEQKASFTLDEVSLSQIEQEEVQSKFDLEVGLNLTAEGIELEWTYDVALFDEEYISTLDRHLTRVLTELSQTASQSNQALQAITMLSEQETQRLLSEQEVTLPAPRQGSIHRLFEAQVAERASKSAVEKDGQSLTYQALNERANQLAKRLQNEHGVRSGSLVGICMSRSLDMAVSVLAILKAGAAYVPLDPEYPQARLAYMCNDTKVALVLCDTAHEDKLPEDVKTLSTLEASEYSSENLKDESDENSLAYVIYTSGSTGVPKGVMITHKSLVNYQAHIAHSYGISSEDRVLQFSSMSFDIFVEEFFGALCHGASLVFRNDEMMQSASGFYDYCEAHEISVVSLPTAYYESICRSERPQPAPLRLVIVGGEALKSTTVAAHLKGRDGVQLINSYGPTEATITAITHVVQSADSNGVVPIGKRNLGVELLVLSPDGSLSPMGGQGELYIGGACLAAGYLNQEQKTAESFIDNPYYGVAGSRSKKLYKTGDLVRYLADGNLQFVGRVDGQVKVNGYRIEVDEITVQLSNLAGVDSALVLHDKEQQVHRLHAFIARQAGGTLNDEEF
ncbi:non-ribosomal peptide synthetase, partial [Pseudoalteromonas luteoviolacea]